MRYRKLSPTGDYSFGNSQLDFYVNEPNAIGQLVKTSLLLWLGEWFLDNTLGFPYLQGVIGKYSQDTADSNIQAYILTLTGVVDIISYVSALDADTRAYSFTCEIDTIYGPTTVQIANYSLY